MNRRAFLLAPVAALAARVLPPARPRTVCLTVTGTKSYTLSAAQPWKRFVVRFADESRAVEWIAVD